MYIQNATKHCYFNSQPHEEADLSAYNTLIQGCISTHSLTKRLTEDHDGITGAEIISTHSLTKRLTHVLSGVDLVTDISTHSLTKRLTQ